MKMKMFRQGDVLVRQVNEIPTDAKDVTPNDRIVLAYGEVTGHAHAIAPDEARELSWTDAGNAVRRFLDVAASATIRHEEHDAIVLPPGLYEIVQQREYSPEEIRNVQD